MPGFSLDWLCPLWALCPLQARCTLVSWDPEAKFPWAVQACGMTRVSSNLAHFTKQVWHTELSLLASGPWRGAHLFSHDPMGPPQVSLLILAFTLAQSTFLSFLPSFIHLEVLSFSACPVVATWAKAKSSVSWPYSLICHILHTFLCCSALLGRCILGVLWKWVSFSM